jgi:type III secretion protein T
MIDTLLADYAGMQDYLISLGVVQARLMPLFLLMPFLNRQMVPRTLQFGIAAGLGLLVAPTISVDQMPSGLALIAVLLKESILGLMLGYVAAIPFWIMESVGFIIDNQRGASMAATLNPLTGHDTSPLGILFGFAFITYYMAVGGVQVMLTMIYDSYRLWPPLSFWPDFARADWADLLMGQLNFLLTAGMLLAAPVMVAMFMAELSLALVSRFAPQLQVFFLAMPIKSALGLLVLILYTGTLFDFIDKPLRATADWVLRIDPGLKPEGAR